jgi:hypothetical protein
MTPKFSIKRNAILKDYSETIENLYATAATEAESLNK